MADSKKQDVKPNDQTESLDDKIASAVKKAVEEAMPVSSMAAAKVLGDMLRPPKKVPEFHPGQHCNRCGQLLTACRGNHVKMVVAPSSPRRYESFPGIFVNGVMYKSPDTHTPIDVPAENNIAEILQRWNQGEEDLREGRSLTHNSGTISPYPNRTNVQEANPIGFRGLAPR